MATRGNPRQLSFRNDTSTPELLIYTLGNLVKQYATYPTLQFDLEKALRSMEERYECRLNPEKSAG